MTIDFKLTKSSKLLIKFPSTPNYHYRFNITQHISHIKRGIPCLNVLEVHIILNLSNKTWLIKPVRLNNKRLPQASEKDVTINFEQTMHSTLLIQFFSTSANQSRFQYDSISHILKKHSLSQSASNSNHPLSN